MKKEKPESKSFNKSKEIDWLPHYLHPEIYHWRYFSKDIGHYYQYSLDETHNLEEIPQDERCIEVQLFKYPDNGSMAFYEEYNKWQENLIGDYFHKALEDWAFHKRANLKELFTILIIPKNLYYKILNKINEFELLHIRDLILETIAITQYIISDQIWFWNNPENRKLMITAQTEMEKAVKVIELSGVHHRSLESAINNPSPGLSSITFKFNDKTTVKIEHKWLAKEFVLNFVRYYDSLIAKDWRIDLAKYPESFGNSFLKDSFEKQIIHAYYTLFTENQWLVSKSKYPSTMMQCIGCFLEFSLIPVGQPHYTQARKGKNVLELLRQINGENKG